MKVLMQGRKTLFEVKGGDSFQLFKTKQELENIGISVDISLEYEPNLKDYDIVHLSNITRIHETYLQLKNAINQNKPVVLSTIYWPYDEMNKKGQFGFRKFINTYFKNDSMVRLRSLCRYMLSKNNRDLATQNLWKIGFTEMQKFVVNNVDYFLPNAEMEMDALCDNFNIPKGSYTVIPNAIDAHIAKYQYDAETPKEFEKYKDAIICVGRIEPRKNQLALVKALDQSGYKLVLVGAAQKNQNSYFNKVNNIMRKNKEFYYIPQIENEKLYQLYKVCKVSVLPSWLDTPGLVSLEAASMGCNLAVSSKGTTTEYFGNYAEYCLPDDLKSIRDAIDRAYNKPRTSELRNIILNNYTWEIAAKKTAECYQKILQEKSKNKISG